MKPATKRVKLIIDGTEYELSKLRLNVKGELLGGACHALGGLLSLTKSNVWIIGSGPAPYSPEHLCRITSDTVVEMVDIPSSGLIGETK